MAQIGRRELLKKLRKKYRFEYLTLFGQEVEMILKRQENGTDVVLGILNSDDWKFKHPVGQEHVIHWKDNPMDTDNELYHYCEQFDSFRVVRLMLNNEWVFLLTHAYIRERTDETVMTSVLLITDQHLREIIYNENK